MAFDVTEAHETAYRRSSQGIREVNKGTYLEAAAREIIHTVCDVGDRSRNEERSQEMRISYVIEMIALMQSYRSNEEHCTKLTY